MVSQSTVFSVRIPVAPPAKSGSPYVLARTVAKTPQILPMFLFGRIRRAASVALDRGWRMHFSPQPLYRLRESSSPISLRPWRNRRGISNPCPLPNRMIRREVDPEFESLRHRRLALRVRVAESLALLTTATSLDRAHGAIRHSFPRSLCSGASTTRIVWCR